MRRTRAGAATERRVWRCNACRRQFSVLTGTPLAGTRVPLAVWLAVADDVAARAPELSRRHGVSAATARRMLAVLGAAGDGPRRLRRVLRTSVERVPETAGIQRGPSADYR